MREETALLDLREEAQFALNHPLFASQLSAGRIEVEILDRVPRRGCCIVLYDDGDGLVEDASRRLESLGYTDVRVLEGGLDGWRAAGFELFQDVNSYCKAFGELVEHRRHTPSLAAPDVQALIDSSADIKILDARRFDEYVTMSIPTGTSVPGAELVLRAPAMAPNPDTTIIVNCAGRTRSIIGTQSLINADLPNRVFALRNGTIGWTLAGQKLAVAQESSSSRRAGRRATWPTVPACDMSHRPRPQNWLIHRGRYTVLMYGNPTSFAPAIFPDFEMYQGANWCRKPTWRRRCAVRASFLPMISVHARI